ncbi:ABC transporter ATP-binding protein [Clostridium sp. BJN0001]|uniref:ABC transporter ATP-binding protein n=1 Tax=Clostridium sp. BJN0001 TaxID=2930219 RepID=UPI001FD10525|nr:ABC transporter ATP-binding protein [Clostridium sp. BJN0001]
MENIIETKNLTKSYGKARGIIDLNLEVHKGEIFGFIGPNGAGKSTTIRTLLSIIYQTSGEAKIFGMDSIKDAVNIKKEIGYLPSEVNYYDDMKVRDILKYSAKFYNKDCTKRIKELSEFLELDLNKKIEDLSLGNKKKTAIIQAVLHEPKLLILDEPTSGLDPLMQSRFFEILKEENRKGTTIFFSSHILSEVQKMCSKVAIIKEGRILRVEEIEKLRKNKYKKIRIEFESEKDAEDFSFQGVLNKKVENRTVSFIYNGQIINIVNNLYEKKIDNLWIEEPSLEEIFMHYYTEK